MSFCTACVKGLPVGPDHAEICHGFSADKTRSVLQDWVMALPLAVQGVLVCAIRGPDGAEKEADAKPLVRAYRKAIMHNAYPRGTKDDDFMGDHSGRATPEAALKFLRNVDHYPHHWFMHLVHAAQVVGYESPDPNHSAFWSNFYAAAVHRMHLNPETKEQMWARLTGPKQP